MALAATSYVVILDSIGVSVAFARIEEAFPDTPRTTLAWVSTGFSITLASLLLLGGRLADRNGRKRVFISGSAIYLVGACISTTAPHVAILIAGRVVGGVGGALMTVTAIALALPMFPSEHRGLALGWLGVAGALASVLGPILGSTMVELVGWRGAFGMTIPFALIILVFGKRILVESEVAADPGGLDLISVVVGTSAVALFTLGVIQGSSWGWASISSLAVFGASMVLLPLFLYRSATSAAPLLSLAAFQDRRFAVGTLAQMGSQLGIFAWFFGTPLFLQNVWNWSTIDAGWALAGAMTLGVISVPAGRWADRNGYRTVLVVGSTIASSGVVWWIVTLGENPSLWTGLVPGLFLFGLGAGFVGLPGTGAALVGITDTNLGTANAAHQTVRRLVQAMGVAVAVSVVGSRDADSVANFKWVWAITAAGYAFSAITILVAYPRGMPETSTERQ
jgi:MFS family permease